MEKCKNNRVNFKKITVCILLVFFISAFGYFIVGCSDPGLQGIEELEASYVSKFHKILDKADLDIDANFDYDGESDYDDDSDYGDSKYDDDSDYGESDYDDDSDYGESDYGEIDKLEADDIEFKITGPKFVEGQNIFYYRVFVDIDDGYSVPGVNFSRDDSKDSLGPLAAQVNLSPGEQYTLIVSIPSLSISKSFLLIGPSDYDDDSDYGDSDYADSDYDDDSDYGESDYDDDSDYGDSDYDDDDDDDDSDYDD